MLLAMSCLKSADGSINHDFKGKLSFSWPNNPIDNENRNDEAYSPLLPYGFGLTYNDSNVLKDDLVEQTQQTEKLDDLVLFERAIKAPWSLVLKSGEQQKSGGEQSRVIRCGEHPNI